MYPPGGGGGNSGVPLRSLNNKPTSQGDLSLKGVGVVNKHHSLTDIENKSSGSFDGHIVGQQTGSTTAGAQSAGHTSTMSAPSTTGVVSSKNANKSTFQDPDLSFLEQITRMQSKRLDDQRCSLKPPSSSSLQSGGKNQVKSSGSGGKSGSGGNGVGSGGSTIPNEDFFDLIIKSQRSR